MVHKLMEGNEVTDLWSYLMSIEWKDPWFMVLLSFHMIITTTTILTRNHGSVQIFLFLGLILLVYFSDSINEYAAHNWHSFSRQQYFDSKGLFISVVFSMPILINCMVLVGTWLYQSTELMAKLKIAQMKAQVRRQKSLDKKSE